jgi:hypothetical protein
MELEMNFNNRIDHHMRKIEAQKAESQRREKIAEIEEVACDLHDAFFGNEFDRDSLLRAEEYLMEFVRFLKEGN